MEEKPCDYLRKLQLTEKEILDEIVRICNKYKLDYYLIGGTLLGAVRHKGFIPWDDDLDIVMPRKDYDMFCKICMNGELDQRYFLHSIETDPNYWLRFAKVRKKNTLMNEKNIAHLDVPKGIYVDIFPLDDAKCVRTLGKTIRTKAIQFLSLAIYRKIGMKFRHKFYVEVALLIVAGLSIHQLTVVQKKLMTYENGRMRDYYVNYGSNYHTEKQTMPKDVYEPAGEIEFEHTIYKCPNDCNYVLKRIYGSDYMQLPPEDKRVTHSPVSVSFDLL